MSREVGFTGNSLHAYGVCTTTELGGAQRATAGKDTPRLQWVISNDGLMDSFLLCTYRLLFPLEEMPIPSP